MWKEELTHVLKNVKEWVEQTNVNPFLRKDINNQLNDMDEPVQVLLAGIFSAGKSSFINAFIEENLLVTGREPKTSAITRVVYSENREIIARYKNGQSFSFPIGMLEALTTQDSPLQENLDTIDIGLPLNKLKKINLVDSPGIDAKDLHTQTFESYYERVDVVLWMFIYEHAGKPSEVNYIQRFKESGVPVYGLINYIDEFDEGFDEEEDGEDLEEYLSEMDRKMGPFEVPLIGISARQALNAKLENDEAAYEESYWPQVEDIFEHINELQQQLKFDSQYNQWSSLISSLHISLKTEKDHMPMSAYQSLVTKFSKQELEKWNEFNSSESWELDQISYLLDSWESFSDTVIEHEDSLEEITEEFSILQNSTNIYLSTINDQTDAPRLPLEKLSALEKDMKTLESSHFSEMNKLKAFHKELTEEWEDLSARKMFGVRKINQLEDKVIFYEDSQNQLFRRIKTMKGYKEDYLSTLDNLTEEINHYYYTTVMDVLIGRFTFLSERLVEDQMSIQKQFDPLDLDKINRIHSLLTIQEDLKERISPAFQWTEAAYINSKSYQKAYVQFKRLESLNEERLLGEEEKTIVEKMFRERDPEEGREWKRGKVQVMENGFDFPVLELPPSLGSFDLETLEKKLRRKQKWMGFHAVAISASLFLYQQGIIEDLLDSTKSEVAAVNEEKEESYDQSSTATSSEVLEEKEVEEEKERLDVTTAEINEFLQNYRSDYFQALNNKSFSHVSDQLVPDSQAFLSLEKYITDISTETYRFFNEYTEVTNYSLLEENPIHVDTFETFTYEEENGDLIHYEKQKTYTLIYQNDRLFIENINTRDTKKQKESLETASLVNSEQVFSFVEDFLVWRTDAKNTQSSYGFDEYTPEGGDFYQEIQEDIRTTPEQYYSIDTGWSFDVYQINEKQYQLDIIVEEKAETSPDAYSITTTDESFILSVNQNGKMMIEDQVKDEVLGYEEFSPPPPSPDDVEEEGIYEEEETTNEGEGDAAESSGEAAETEEEMETEEELEPEPEEEVIPESEEETAEN